MQQLAAIAVLASGAACAQQPMIFAPGDPGTIAAGTTRFTPPDASTIPDTPLGAMIRFGRDVFVNTQRYAKPYVGNGLNCVNCHLDEGRAADSAPMWAAYVVYPLFRDVNQQVNTFSLMLEYCFRYSMNGTMPPNDGAVVTGLISYAFWLANGAPVGAQLAGRGYRVVPAPAQGADVARGEDVYASYCQMCHGASGAGLKAGATWVFPPLWGQDSYSAGAGMHKVPIAAAFIKTKMPYKHGNTLTDQQAWDVASYINSKPRPRDPGLPPQPR
ncbi:MAG: c-type cytochrome [Casimicrobiaceae bacterium]